MPISEDADQISGNDPKLFKLQTIQRMASTKDTSLPSSTEINTSSGPTQETDPVTLMLSCRQANLLLSSLWTQALSPENVPRNYEAISYTYSMMLLFSGAKNSCLEVLVGSFQLAFSLRSSSLQAGFLPSSRRRSLFTLATSMLVFFPKAFNVPSLIPTVKELLTENTVLPVGFIFEDDTLVEPSDILAEPQLGHPLDNNLLDVNQLLESVLETSRHVGRLSVSTNHDLAFMEVANQCEALLIGKQQKLSVCVSVHQQELRSQDSWDLLVGESFTEKLELSQPVSATAGLLYTNDDQCLSNFCKLPILNPYDKFLTAAGC